MSTYTIKQEEIGSYVKREVAKKMKMIGSIMTIVLGGFFLFFYSYNVHTIIMLPMIGIFSIVFLFVCLLSFPQIQSMGLKTTFVVSEKIVSVTLAKEKMSVVSQLLIQRNEVRSGERYNQSFSVKQIESTTIKPHEIVIKSFDYNIFNGNGKITIPKELHDFQAIKKFITANATKFKLVQ